MKKRFFFIMGIMIALMPMFMQANVMNDPKPVPLRQERIKPSEPDNPKSPALTPTVYINENTVSFGSELEGFTLKILDEDGVVVYSTVIAAGTSQVVLSSTLYGEYEIRFVTDDYYYYGYITL